MESDACLGALIKKWTIAGTDDPTNTLCAMLSDWYVKSATRDVEQQELC